MVQSVLPTPTSIPAQVVAAAPPVKKLFKISLLEMVLPLLLVAVVVVVPNEYTPF